MDFPEGKERGIVIFSENFLVPENCRGEIVCVLLGTTHWEPNKYLAKITNITPGFDLDKKLNSDFLILIS